jgi:orotate phosphoribosyltransferase-like protein
LTEGMHDQRCIIVDDLISSGETFRRVILGIERIHCKAVGFVLYNDRTNYIDYHNVPCWGNVKT